MKDKLGEEMERYSFNISDRGQGSSLCIQHILSYVFEDIKTRTCQFKLLCGWCFHNLPTLCSEISVGVVFVLFECSMHNQCRKYTDIRYMVLPLVFPVVKSLRVNRGVTDATVSWSMQESLTHMNLICQVATVPLGTLEVNSFKLIIIIIKLLSEELTF